MFAISQDDRVERSFEYLANLYRGRKFFIDNYNVEPEVINGNQMPIHTYVQWLAKKLAVSISVIRKLAVVFIPVEIQKFY